MIREGITMALAVGVPAGVDALTAMEIPVIGLATLALVAYLGVRQARVERVLSSVKEGIFRMQGPSGT